MLQYNENKLVIADIRDLLMPGQCYNTVKYIDSILDDGKKQKIIRAEKKSKELIEMFFHRIDKTLLKGNYFGPHITLSKSNHAIGKHIDNQISGHEYTHKLFIYLNQIQKGGGTYFSTKGVDEFYSACEVGKGVLFDINTPHWSEDFPATETKYTIGFRINIK